MRRDEWIDDDEYPDDDDIAAFGDDSPPDDDRLTIGYVEGLDESFVWTPQRIALAVIALLLFGALVLPLLAQFFN